MDSPTPGCLQLQSVSPSQPCRTDQRPTPSPCRPCHQALVDDAETYAYPATDAAFDQNAGRCGLASTSSDRTLPAKDSGSSGVSNQHPRRRRRPRTLGDAGCVEEKDPVESLVGRPNIAGESGPGTFRSDYATSG